MSERDPFALLQMINPVAGLEESDERDVSLLAAIVATPLPERPRRRWWWVGSGAVVVVVGAMSYASFRSEPARNPTTVVCYSNPAVPPDDQVALGAEKDPVVACEKVWSTGEFGSGATPHLTACVTKTDIVAVVPGNGDVCEQLGLRLWNTVVNGADRAIIEFNDEITQTLRDACYPEPEATTLTKAAMDRHGLGDWTVASNGNWSTTVPCTAIGIDPTTKTVTLGARPRFPTDKNP
jgi:hypothetical protein